MGMSVQDGLYYTNWCGKTEPTVGSTTAWIWVLNYTQVWKMSWAVGMCAFASLWPWLWVRCDRLLWVPAAQASPACMGCHLQLWAKLLFIRDFHHSSKDESRTCCRSNDSNGESEKSPSNKVPSGSPVILMGKSWISSEQVYPLIWCVLKSSLS